MKAHLKTVGLVFLVFCVFVACRTPDRARGGDSGSLEQAFATADAAFQAVTERVAVSMQRGEYLGAAAELEGLRLEASLSEAQRAAVEATLARVQAAMTDLNNLAALEARRAFGGLPAGGAL